MFFWHLHEPSAKHFSYPLVQVPCDKPLPFPPPFGFSWHLQLPLSRHTSDFKGHAPWEEMWPFTRELEAFLHDLHMLSVSPGKNRFVVLRHKGLESEQDPPLKPQWQLAVPSTVWQILLVPIHSDLLPHVQIPPVQVWPIEHEVEWHWHTFWLKWFKAHIGVFPEHDTPSPPHWHVPSRQVCPCEHVTLAHGSEVNKKTALIHEGL